MLKHKGGNTVNILLVEDNPGDIELTRRALKMGKILNNLMVTEDGLEAMEILNRTGKYRDVPKPDLILLDLNLPGNDGRAILAEIKENPELKTIPVVVLTSSQAEEDILKTYELHANCFITKPVDFNSFIEVVRKIENFWFDIVQLPKGK